MLDANLISFVEPIGPGQIVDRESLVALPVGYLQISIENSCDQLVTKILAARGIGAPEFEENDLCNFLLKSYIWQNGEVLAGAEDLATQTGTLGRKTRSLTKGSSLKRGHPGSCSFSFRKQQSENGMKNDKIVDAILQVCVYKASKGTVKRKTFLGTVHIALKYLTSNQPRNTTECLSGRDDWFKIFPKSTFLPGSPSDIAKTNCYISGQSVESQSQNLDDNLTDDEDDNETCSHHSAGSNSNSVISFYQYDIKSENKTKGNTSPRVAHKKEKTNASTKNRSYKPQKKNQQQDETSSRYIPRAVSSVRRSISMFLVRARSVDEVKATGGKERHSSDATEISSFSPPTPPVLVGFSSEFISSDNQAQCCVRRKHPLHGYSSSTSVDVGYESGRSRCTSSDDDVWHSERVRVPVKKDYNIKEIVKADVIEKEQYDSLPGTSSLARPIIFNKPALSKRHTASPLRRSTRISEIPGFTSLSEIGKGF
uniref:uncharacterized protein LOC120336637 n=1 Tax=Styela clava TaxID=7725 RepID=UPI00193AB928|nr:uncharacterized protein LOC120336637 [Styela clava]